MWRASRWAPSAWAWALALAAQPGELLVASALKTPMARITITITTSATAIRQTWTGRPVRRDRLVIQPRRQAIR